MDVARPPGLRCQREGRLPWQEGVPAEAGQQEHPAEPPLWLPECEVVSAHIVTGQDTC